MSTGSLVEHLAEAEQQLLADRAADGGSGNNSMEPSEERDSVIEGAAIVEDLERSNAGDARSDLERSNVGDARSEVGSDGSRLVPKVSGAEDSPAGSSSFTDSLSALSERINMFRADDEDSVQPAMQSQAMWQRLKETQDAKRAVDTKLRQAQEDIESMRETRDRELTDLKKQIDSNQVSAAKELLIQRKQLSREHMMLKRQLQLSEDLAQNAGNENEVMRRNVKALQKSHADEVADLKGRLDPGKKSAEDERDSLSRQLDNSRAEQREMAAELNEMHLKMLSADRLRHSEVGDLKMMLDSASHKLEMCEHGGNANMSRMLNKQAAANRSRRGATPKKAPASSGKLDVIEEDMSDMGDLASLPDSASGFNVSSDAEGEGVGDMRDFDEDELFDLVIKESAQSRKDIKDLEVAAAIQKQVAQDLAADVAAREADYESKIQRLMEQLDMSRKVHDMSAEELEVLKELTKNGEAGGVVQMLTEKQQQQGKSKRQQREAEAEMDEEESPPADDLLQARDNRIGELQEQLNVLREVNRIAEARVEDLKHALAAEEKKRKKEVEEMKQRVLMAGNDSKQDEIEDLRHRLKNAEEEKNMLVNTFECKELQWRTQIENMELELDQVRRKRDSETARFQSDIAQLEASVREAMERKEAVEASHQEAIALSSSASALGWLWRCPLRGGVGGELRPMYCQDSCWNVVSAISNCVALWCSMQDYTIQQASREANRIWSSSMLHGKSFFSLASGPSSVTWLKKAFHSHQRISDMDHPTEQRIGAAGFIVRDLGCEAFTTKSGESFDSSVITAHFPAEPACGRPTSLLVILEPQSGRGSGPSRSPAPGGPPDKAHSTTRSRSSNGMRGTSHSGRLGSSRSEVSTSSVSPSDSASNVLGFR